MSTDNRKSRTSESRIATDREKQAREMFAMVAQGPLYIDPKDIPEGFEYRWIRTSILGKPDPHRLVSMSRKGYTPVPADRHPQFISNEKGHIEEGGLILCEREKYLAQYEENIKNQESLETLKSIPGQEEFMRDPTMPMQVLSNQTMLERHLSSTSFAE